MCFNESLLLAFIVLCWHDTRHQAISELEQMSAPNLDVFVTLLVNFLQLTKISLSLRRETLLDFHNRQDPEMIHLSFVHCVNVIWSKTITTYLLTPQTS